MTPDNPVEAPPAPSLLTRRRVLVGGAIVGGTVALRGVPALGQEEGSTTSSSTTTSTTSTTSTTTTTTAPPATTPPTTTAPPYVAAPPVPTQPAHPTDEAPRSPAQTRSFGTLLSESPDRKIMWPMLGRPNSSATWTDTYGACRDGCSRAHQGQDLMAPKMTKLLAVKSGTVVELRHRSGGNSLYIQDDEGWFYAYLHINNDAPGTDNAANKVADAWGPGLRQFATGATTMDETAARGYRVRQGEVLAYCGDSGNAEGSGSHLHFEIRKPASGSFSSETSRLWQSPSVNPKVSLQKAIAAKESTPVPPEAFRPWNSSSAFITAQYQDFLGRTPSSSEIAYYAEILDYGTRTPDWLMQHFLEGDEGDALTQAIARLYQAFYKRLPDTEGFNYWLAARRSGAWSLYRIAEQFARAPEFTRMYGSLSNSAYVDLVYRNVLGRDPDPQGKAYWVGELDKGVTRGRVMVGFSSSPEYRAEQRNRMHVVGCYGVMLDRIPTTSELAAWKKHLDDGGITRDMITMLRMTDEYRTASGF
jgi:murein DD-endopeptidase MepM/ murein hydrolase activator NlpD